MAYSVYSFTKLFNDVLKTYEVTLAFEERYKDIWCQVCKVLPRTISGRGQRRKSPIKLSWWDLFPEPDSVTSISWAQLRITFSLRIKQWPEKARSVRHSVWLLSFEPGPNPAQTWILSVLPGPGPAFWAGRAEARGPGPGQWRPPGGSAWSAPLSCHCAPSTHWIEAGWVPEPLAAKGRMLTSCFISLVPRTKAGMDSL
jgi:hypothetical protein